MADIADPDRPHVYVLATGGTISGIGKDRLDIFDYSQTGRRATVEQLIDRIPEATNITRLRLEQYANTASVDLTPSDWLRLSGKISGSFAAEEGLTAALVTIGTAALEDLAFFLHLTVRSTKALVVTGAMRPLTALGTDAEANLLAALWVAGSDKSRAKGVLVVMGTEIHSAREARIDSSYALNALTSGEVGPLGYVEPHGEVVFYRVPVRRHTFDSEFDISSISELPAVEVVWSCGGTESRRMIVDTLQREPSGIVVAAPEGVLPSDTERLLMDAMDQKITVVVCSRFGTGRVPGTAALASKGFVPGDNLAPNKAKILLMLGLTKTLDRRDLCELFLQY